MEDETNKVKITLQNPKQKKKHAFSKIMTALYSDVMSTESLLYSVMQAWTPWSFTKMAFTWKHNCQRSLTEWFKKFNFWWFGDQIWYYRKEFFGIFC